MTANMAAAQRPGLNQHRGDRVLCYRRVLDAAAPARADEGSPLRDRADQ